MTKFDHITVACSGHSTTALTDIANSRVPLSQSEQLKLIAEFDFVDYFKYLDSLPENKRENFGSNECTRHKVTQSESSDPGSDESYDRPDEFRCTSHNPSLSARPHYARGCSRLRRMQARSKNKTTTISQNAVSEKDTEAQWKSEPKQVVTDQSSANGARKRRRPDNMGTAAENEEDDLDLVNAMIKGMVLNGDLPEEELFLVEAMKMGLKLNDEESG